MSFVNNKELPTVHAESGDPYCAVTHKTVTSSDRGLRHPHVVYINNTAVQQLQRSHTQLQLSTEATNPMCVDTHKHPDQRTHMQKAYQPDPDRAFPLLN